MNREGKSYSQYCALARALDRIGDRWVLLIVRELLLGQKRFTDLREALPGIATNLLTERLRKLEANELITRAELPPPAYTSVYELTERGAELEDAVMALIRWGGFWMEERASTDDFRSDWLVLAIQALLASSVPRSLHGVYDLQIEEGVVQIRVGGGNLEVCASATEQSDLSIKTTADTTLGIVSGRTSLSAAIDSKRASVKGGPEEIEAFSKLIESARASSTELNNGRPLEHTGAS